MIGLRPRCSADHRAAARPCRPCRILPISTGSRSSIPPDTAVALGRVPASKPGRVSLFTILRVVSALAPADGSLRGLLARLSRIDVLVIDDWVMVPLSEPERRDFWEICEDRYQVRSTILTSQLPVSRWHEQLGDPTLADGILDHLVHNAHRIEMRGDSMRKNRGKPSITHGQKITVSY